ncbi:MAG TPA: isoprenylcysteine carboxylmethyltransferase family protein [Gaiellaceae bacterium]|nr:isoprenylcysteine carboxylmethyltransferase family protein [Gaiellaceae bacterium]
MRALQHALAVLLLPGVVVVLVPAFIAWRTGSTVGWGLPVVLALAAVLLGGVLVAIGSVFVVWAIARFVRMGRGTLAPWNPTSRLVVHGPYRYVRNPMISGALFLLLGEAVLLGSVSLLVWFALVGAVNAIYLPLVEEPGLVRRYGEAYEQYRAHVPRWFPRRRPWDPDQATPAS